MIVIWADSNLSFKGNASLSACRCYGVPPVLDEDDQLIKSETCFAGSILVY